jgi:hypothetical protein
MKSVLIRKNSTIGFVSDAGFEQDHCVDDVCKYFSTDKLDDNYQLLADSLLFPAGLVCVMLLCFERTSFDYSFAVVSRSRRDLFWWNR